MGKMLGGGSGINTMVWSQWHKKDWDCSANEADDPPAGVMHQSSTFIVASKTDRERLCGTGA
jgi:hypothetical protein